MKRLYLTCADICGMLNISRSKGYEIIRALNDELQKKGYITVSGKTSPRYFSEKLYITMEEIESYLQEQESSSKG